MMNNDQLFGGMTWSDWVVMGFLWLVALIIVVGLVVYVMRGRTSGEPSDDERYRSARVQHAATQEDAIATLDSRLARGEIDSVSYDAMRGRLEQRRWNGVERRSDNARTEESTANR
jgi:uncharacterized membrane protein